MLPKALRLPPGAIRRGKKFQNQLFSARTEPNRLGVNRFIFVVSKKTAKTAVLRHRIKRLLSEVSRKLPSRGRDIAVVALPAIAAASPGDISRELQKLLN